MAANRVASYKAVLCAFLFIVPSLAAQSSQTGTVTGHVYNANTRQFLDNAKVVVAETGTSVVTARDGAFRFSGLATGEYTLVATYPSLDDGQVTVSITPSQTVRKNIELTSTMYELDAVVVAAEAEGDAAAVAKQRASVSSVEVVSALKFGAVNEGNVGEFLKNLPGMQINYVAADARTVSIRGQSDNFTQVTINGTQPAQAGSSNTNRNFEFEQTNIQNIESIEVIKVPTPAMSPAIGGTVNLITKSPFDYEGRVINVTAGLSGNTEKLSLGKSAGPPSNGKTHKVLPNFAVSYSDTFLDRKLGVALNYISSNQYNPQHTNIRTYAYPGVAAKDVTASTPGYVASQTVNDVGKFTERRNYGTNFIYKVSDNTSVRWESFHDDYYAETNSPLLFIESTSVQPLPGYSLERAEFAQDAGVRFRQTAQNNFAKYTSGWGSTVAVDHDFNQWEIKYEAAYSQSKNRYTALEDGFAANMGGGAIINNVGYKYYTPTDASLPVEFIQTAGPNLYDLANYRATQISDFFFKSKDEIKSGKISVRRNFEQAAKPFYLEGGLNYKFNERQIYGRYLTSHTWVGLDGVGGTADDAGGIPLTQFPQPNWDEMHDAPAFSRIPYPNYHAIAEYYAENPQVFQLNEAKELNDRLRTTRSIQETLQAAYVMGQIEVIPKLTLLGGVRFEKIKDEGVGPLRLPASASAGITDPIEKVRASWSTVEQSSTYNAPLFKNLQAKFEIRPNLIARASYYDGVAYQNFGDLIPNTSVNETSIPPSVTAVNTGLKPQLSRNYEVDLEYYFKPAGVLTLAWYRKSIDNYIVNDISMIGSGADNGYDGDYAGYELISKRNGGSAEYKGIEVNFTHQMGYLPSYLSGISVGGSYSNMYEINGFLNTGNVSELPGLIEEITNIRLGYRSPAGRFFGEIRKNIRGRHLNSTALPFGRYNERLAQLDLTLRWKVTERWSLEVTGRNISESPTVVSQGPNRYFQWADYGSNWNMGINARF